MAANRVLHVILTVFAVIVVPLQLVTTLVLGIVVSLSFGLLLLPLSFVWIILLLPLLGGSWLCSRAAWLRNPIGVLGVPWAVLANTYVCLIPSMGEIESRVAKLIITETWPFSWEFYQFQMGRFDLDSTPAEALREVLARVSRDEPARQLALARMARHESMDPEM